MQMHWRVLIVILGSIVVLAPLLVSGQSSAPQSTTTTERALPEPLDLVPADTLLCWYGRPFPDAPPPSDDPSALGALLRLIPRIAGPALDKEAQLWTRIGEGFNLMIRYPHAVGLIDAQAQPVKSDPNARRADKLRCFLIIQTRGHGKHFSRIIQAAINEQTDKEKATLKLLQAGHWDYQELHDQRLPDWCKIAWGSIGDYFVMTVGEDVWPDVAAVAAGKAPSVVQTKWLSSVRGKRGREALIEIIVATRDIRQRLDPFVNGRATDFFEAWNCADMERAHWALGFEGRAMYCVAHFFENGKPSKHVYADPAINDPRLLATIPDTARYAIYRVPPEIVIPRFLHSMLATRDISIRQDTEELWNRIQEEYGFDARQDILAHLGQHIVMHNDPPHPMHVPMAMTTLTEIRSEPRKVRATIDRMGEAWLELQDKHFQETGQYNPMRIAREKPNIWCLRFGPDAFGLAGPAWTVTDRFIITSWSPNALRSYLDKVGDRAGKHAQPKPKAQ
ncbi:MAG: hypothetical protein ABIG44_12685 [Planctomycetota bacterium]